MLNAPREALIVRQTDRQKGRQVGRQEDRETDRQTSRLIDIQTDRQAGDQPATERQKLKPSINFWSRL